MNEYIAVQGSHFIHRNSLILDYKMKFSFPAFLPPWLPTILPAFPPELSTFFNTFLYKNDDVMIQM